MPYPGISIHRDNRSVNLPSRYLCNMCGKLIATERSLYCSCHIQRRFCFTTDCILRFHKPASYTDKIEQLLEPILKIVIIAVFFDRFFR